jgi:hypothetical protein
MKKMRTPAVLIATLLLAGTTLAAQRYWTGKGSTEIPPNLNFSAATNWINQLLPVSGDDATIRGQFFPENDARAIMTDTWILNNIRIGGAGSLSTEGTPTLTLDPGSDLTWSNTLDVGYSLVGDTNAANGILEINDGVHNGKLWNIAKAAGTSPWATTGEVTIVNATLNLSGITKIATGDLNATGETVGTVTLNSGATVSAAPATGTHAVYVGDTGTGKLIINGGTFITASNTVMFLGKTATGDGTVELNDGLLNLGKAVQIGSGTGLIDIRGGLLINSDGAWRKGAYDALIASGNITSSGGGSSAEEDALFSATYTQAAGLTNLTANIALKWGVAGTAGSYTNAVWAVDTTPPPGTRLTIGYEGDGWPGGFQPTLTAVVSIDGTGAVSSDNAFITVSLSGNPLPASLYNTSFIYDVNGQGDLDPVTGLGASEQGLSIAAVNDSIVPGSGIRNTVGDTGLMVHDIDPGGLPAGFDIELWEIETRAHVASEVATFIDPVNPTNRINVTGGTGNQLIDVTGLDITVDSSSAETAFVSMCALTNDAATSYRLQTLTLNIIDQASQPPPAGTYEAWIIAYTNELSEAEQAKDADPEGDGLANLMEFAIGGDPTIDDAASVQPTGSLVGSELEYLYNRRTNHAELGLSYYLELTPDLFGTFTNDTAAYTVTGVSGASGEYETVTNSVATSSDAAKFIRLTVEE